MQTFSATFAGLDPRRQNSRHDFCEILFISAAASLCGAKNCSDMERFGQEKEALLRTVLELEHGIPSHDVFSGVFRKLDREAFAAAFARFTAGLTTAAARHRHIAIDGKVMRGAVEAGARHLPPRLMVTAWGSEVRMSLAAQPAEGGNESRAALDLLGLLDLDGAWVTADALHCTKPFASRVVEAGGEYCLALKGNQPKLAAAAKEIVEARRTITPADIDREKVHGREEMRSARVFKLTQKAAKELDFPNLAAIGEVRRARIVAGELEEDSCLYALSEMISARDLNALVRSHWDIENGLHWSLDVVFREDECRSRKDNAPENLALIRRMAMNALRSDSKKDNLRGKIMRAGWNDSYLLELMTQMR